MRFLVKTATRITGDVERAICKSALLHIRAEEPV